MFETLVISCCALLLPISDSDEDVTGWPHIRGPAWNGCAREWDGQNEVPPSPRVLWRTTIGQGFSGFVIRGDRAFTQSQTRAGQQALCLDIHTGTVLWRTRYEFPWEPDGPYPGPYASPTLAGGRIFFCGAYGTIYCARDTDGKLLWSRDLNRIEGFVRPGFGYACTPLVVDGKVVVFGGESGPSLIALNAEDGEVLWMSGSDGSSYSSPMPFELDGATHVFAFLQNAAVLHDLESGMEVARYPWSSGYDPHPAWPLIESYRFVLSAPFHRGAEMIEIDRTATGAPAFRCVWTSPEFSHDIFPSVIVDGYAYGADIRSLQSDDSLRTEARFVCLDLSSGSVRWQTEATGHASVLAIGGWLVIVSERGTLMLARASPKGFGEISRMDVLDGERCWTLPAYGSGMILVRGAEHAAAVALRFADVGRGTAAPATPRRPKALLEAYQSQQWVEPDAETIWVWFLGGVGGLLLPMLFLPRWRLTAALLAVALGIAGPWFLSPVAGRLVFTWPAVLYAACQALLILRCRIRSSVGGWASAVLPRALLALFAGLCLAYYRVCVGMFLTSGLAFVPAVIAAVPFLWLDSTRNLPLAARLGCTVAGFGAQVLSAASILVMLSG
jgi:outer membrane protein assembly factor BamB